MSSTRSSAPALVIVIAAVIAAAILPAWAWPETSVQRALDYLYGRVRYLESMITGVPENTHPEHYVTNGVSSSTVAMTKIDAALRADIVPSSITSNLVNPALDAVYRAVGDGSTSADLVSYDGSTVEAALDSILNPVSVTLSGGAVYDRGRVITNMSLAWTVSKVMTTRVLSGGASASFGPGGSASYVVTNALDSTQTAYTLTVGDGVATAAASTVNYFRDRMHYGLSATSSGIDDAGIQSLSGSVFTTTSYVLAQTTLTPSGPQYIWVCYPASYGAAQFKLNSLPASEWILETANYTNPYGAVVSYRRYRSPQAYVSPINLEVY